MPYVEIGEHRPRSGLAGFFDDLQKIAGQVGTVGQQVEEAAEQASAVSSGQKRVAVVPTNSATLTVPIPGSQFAASVLLVPVLLGLGAVLLFLGTRRRR